MARKAGSKDKQKRKSRLRRKLIIGASIVGGAAAGAVGAHALEKYKVNKQISGLKSKLGSMANPGSVRGVGYINAIKDSEDYLKSKSFQIKPRAIGGVAGATAGGVVSSTLTSSDGERASNADKGKRIRQKISTINQTSREARGWINVARRISGI